MRGFADIEDATIVSRREIAERLGYSCVASANRALARLGARIPRGPFKGGSVRGDVVKAWVMDLPADDMPAPSPARSAGRSFDDPRIIDARALLAARIRAA